MKWALSMSTAKMSLIEDHNSSVVDQDYANSEGEGFVEDQYVNTATGYGCANSEEGDVQDQDPREVDKEDDSSCEDVQNVDQQPTNIVGTEEERQCTQITASPLNTEQTLAAQEEDDGNDADIKTIVETEGERQEAKEKALHSTAKQSTPNAFVGPKIAAHNVSKDRGSHVTAYARELYG